MPLNNSQYQALMRGYDNRRLQARREQDARQQVVYKKIPALLSVDNHIASLSVSSAKKLLDGDGQALDCLRVELSELIEEKQKLLLYHGFDKDYLKPVFQCPDCKDTGYIHNKKCHCLVQATIGLLYARSNIHEILEEENFNTFRLDFYSKDKKDPSTENTSYETAVIAIERAKDFIRQFDTDYQNLLIIGDTGVGKTFLTNCIAKELLDSAHSVLYFSSVQLFETLAKITFSKNETNDHYLYEELYSYDLLIVDDLGTELTNSFVASQLFLCLNERHLRKKSTIISTNLLLDGLRNLYSERVSSRLYLHYKFIRLFGNDIREKKRQHTWRA